jgi:hypothetical protein
MLPSETPSEPVVVTESERYHRPDPGGNVGIASNCRKIPEMYGLWISVPDRRAKTIEISMR